MTISSNECLISFLDLKILTSMWQKWTPILSIGFKDEENSFSNFVEHGVVNFFCGIY